MPDAKYFGIPFATSGDRATIPEAVQPSGAISFTQGFGPDYERPPATDPLAKRVPRDETNEYLYQITNAIKFLQLYGLPEWTASGTDGGPANYPLTARVRYAGAAYVSLVATNTAVPGTDATKWALDDAFGEASLAEAIAGAVGGRVITPRRMASATQRGAWNYAVAGGTANALTAALSPAPAALTAGMTVSILIASANTGAATLNLNGLGASAIVHKDGTALQADELNPGQVVGLTWDGTRWQAAVSYGRLLAYRVLTASGTYTPTPGTAFVVVEGVGGGGGGAGAATNSAGNVSIGSPGTSGAYGKGRFTAAQMGPSVSVTIGSGGSGAGGAGTSTSFGSLMTLPGGNGGSASNNLTPPSFNGAGALASQPTGANIAAHRGYPPQQSQAISASAAIGGAGGSNAFGTSGAISPNLNGQAAIGYGSGGGGTATLGGAAGVTGGAGAPGLLIIEEYSL